MSCILFSSIHCPSVRWTCMHRHLPCPESECVSCSVVSASLWPHGLLPASLLCPWDSPGKNTGVGSHFLLQGIFPTQDRTQVSWVAGGFLTIWADKIFFFLILNLQGLPGSPLDRFEMCFRQLGDTGNWGLITEGQFQRVREGLPAALVAEPGAVLALQGAACSPRVRLGEWCALVSCGPSGSDAWCGLFWKPVV